MLAVGTLLLVCGCFCQSDRNTGSAQDDPIDSNSSRPLSNRTSSASSDPNKKADQGDFLVAHEEVSTPKYVQIDREIKDEKLLEKAANQLNAALGLPEDITLRTKDCKEANAYYDPNDSSVTMCYELMEYFYSSFRNAGLSEKEAYSQMFDAVRFVFLHEIAHALIDKYKLPIIGNEEDAADRCSAYINLEELGQDGVKAILAAAEAFNLESKRTAGTKRNMADEHLLGEQRYYNALCMVYGSNETKWQKLVSDGYLPEARAVRCPTEYQKAVDAWAGLLGPWRKN